MNKREPLQKPIFRTLMNRTGLCFTALSFHLAIVFVRSVTSWVPWRLMGPRRCHILQKAPEAAQKTKNGRKSVKVMLAAGGGSRRRAAGRWISTKRRRRCEKPGGHQDGTAPATT